MYKHKCKTDARNHRTVLMKVGRVVPYVLCNRHIYVVMDRVKSYSIKCNV